MTIQAIRLLGKLKKAQINPQRLIYIDLDEHTAATIRRENLPYKVVKLLGYKYSLEITLKYLKDQGYIEYDHFCRVLYPGWNLAQTIISKILNFLLKSVAVPIGVSIATTMITLWITGQLGG